VAMPRYPTLDVCCLDCEQAGDPNPPRLARFAKFPDGKVELEPWSANRNAG
jgi:hypothetical protein